MSDEKTRWPFGGFFLKPSDEQNGTHEYEEYLRNCKESPLTEKEQQEWTESARAAIAELEQLNAEPEPTRQAAEAEVISSLQTPEPAELQEGCCTGQEAEEAPEVVPAEAIVPLGQIGGDAPAEKEQWAYASGLIGDAFQHWENGRVLLDMGTGRGKNEFIIKRLVSWRIDEMLTNMIIGRVLCLCPLKTLHAEMLQRRMEAANAESDGEPTEIAMTYDALYEFMLEVQTYQYIEARYRNDPASLKKYLARFKYIVADECHYFTDFSSYGINTYLSLEVLQKAEAAGGDRKDSRRPHLPTAAGLPAYQAEILLFEGKSGHDAKKSPGRRKSRYLCIVRRGPAQNEGDIRRYSCLLLLR